MTVPDAFPVVTYEKNRFFDAVSDPGMDVLDSEIGSVIGHIDRQFNELVTQCEKQGHRGVEAFQYALTPCILKIEQILRQSHLEREIKDWTLVALAGADRQMNLQFRRHAFARDFPVHPPELSDALRKLRRDGFTVFPVPESINARFLAGIAEPKDELRRLADESPKRRLSLRQPEFGAATPDVRAWLRRSGIVDVAQAYMRCK